MKSPIRSHFAASVVGGLAVAGAFFAFGVIGRRSNQTIIEEAPIETQPTSSHAAALTPHAIYTRDAPGVVFVKALIEQQFQDPFDLFPQKVQSSSTGSGFLIRSDGLILTNYHVIQGADRNSGVTVHFEDNVSRPAHVIAEDQNNDLALLKVNMAGVPLVSPLPLGESGSVRVGDPMLAIGNPFGLDRTLTSGIVSALQRQIQAPDGFSIDNVIQTDTPIYPGNSGGPLLDAAGRVVGINSQIETSGDGGTVGISFAIPIDTAKALIPPPTRTSQVALAYLGVRPAGTSSLHGVPVDVAPGGPAADGGVRDRDTINSIAGQSVTKMDQLDAIVSTLKPGQVVAVRVRRGSATKALKVVVGHRPAP
jgi:S1-C subfamily serine protease